MRWLCSRGLRLTDRWEGQFSSVFSRVAAWWTDLELMDLCSLLTPCGSVATRQAYVNRQTCGLFIWGRARNGGLHVKDRINRSCGANSMTQLNSQKTGSWPCASSLLVPPRSTLPTTWLWIMTYPSEFITDGKNFSAFTCSYHGFLGNAKAPTTSIMSAKVFPNTILNWKLEESANSAWFQPQKI